MAEMRLFIQFEDMDATANRPPFAEIGVRLEKIQHLMGFASRREFCSHFNVLETTASMWFSGRSRINLDSALRICEETGLTLEYIYRGNTAGLTLERVRELNKIAA